MEKIKIDFKRMDALLNKLKATLHKTRKQIISMLLEEKEMNVTEIYTRLKTKQAVVSHHLKILRQQNAVIATRKGQNITYKLNPDYFNKINACLDKCL